MLHKYAKKGYTRVNTWLNYLKNKNYDQINMFLSVFKFGQTSLLVKI